MTRVDRWLTEWADRTLVDCNESGLSGINTVEKLLRDPGVATGQGGHKVLWWPHRKKRISKAAHKRASWTSKASHQLTPTERIVLIIHYGNVKNDDKSRFTKFDLAQNSSISVQKYLSIKKGAQRKMSRILSSYHRNGADGEKKKVAN